MTEAAVTTEVHQTFDIELHFTAQITFDFVLTLEDLADLRDIVFGQIVSTFVVRDLCKIEDDAAVGWTNAIDITERDFDTLVTWQVDAC